MYVLQDQKEPCQEQSDKSTRVVAIGKCNTGLVAIRQKPSMQCDFCRSWVMFACSHMLWSVVTQHNLARRGNTACVAYTDPMISRHACNVSESAFCLNAKPVGSIAAHVRSWMLVLGV